MESLIRNTPNTVNSAVSTFLCVVYPSSATLPCLYLQGGPGSSGTGFGNFEELGPLNVELQPREYTWVSHLCHGLPILPFRLLGRLLGNRSTIYPLSHNEGTLLYAMVLM